ncbi:MAG: prepilin-type N-terminal cleavage/methylation domain-containing protein [Lachnospiraceae bacterium]|nr:prepilin-type N-terminal cleavage/methylation domain-containing protein [Lachnospiraceae bacterium]
MNSNNSKLNNNGFTLVELLVALAISGVVMVMVAMLMTNSSTLFKNEKGKINLQNEFQMVDSFLSETIMEAKTLYITNSGNGQTLSLYTGEKNGNALEPVTLAVNELESGGGSTDITTERIITFIPDSNSIFITKSYMATPSKGYLISDNVENFKITIDESCKVYSEVVVDSILGTTEMVHDGYSNPIILNVELSVSDDDNTKNEDFRITIRNKLDKVVVDGTEYSVK